MFTIYGKLHCHACDAAKKLCEDNNIPFEYIQLNDSQGYVDEFFTRLPNATSVPQVFVGDKHIGGLVKLRYEVDTILHLRQQNPSDSDSDHIINAVNDSDLTYERYQIDQMRKMLFGQNYDLDDNDNNDSDYF
jgi:glutaredoxin 3